MDKAMAGDASDEVPEKQGVFNAPEAEACTTAPQIRTSARVYKKLRLDAALTSERRDSESREEAEAEARVGAKATEAGGGSSGSSASKPKRASPTWSTEEKDTFFEALNEFGKDFEAIHGVFVSRAREKSIPDKMVKSKEQIRLFYYRTWHKINKHLKFDDELKRVTQELYALINYGEFRKIVGLVSEKTCMKLNELIQHGHAHFRIRGKHMRVKTPQCPALRKLNRVDEWKGELQLPARVLVELRPRCAADWCRVQSVAQNPRVRTLLPLHQRLSSLLAFLQQRWRPPLLQHRDRLLSAALLAKLQLEVRADHARDPPPRLHLAPPAGQRIALPTVCLSEYLTPSSLSLSAYRERLANREALPSMTRRMQAFVLRPCGRPRASRRLKVSEGPPPEEERSAFDRRIDAMVAAAAAATAACEARAKPEGLMKTELGTESGTDSGPEPSCVPEGEVAPVPVPVGDSSTTPAPAPASATAPPPAVLQRLGLGEPAAPSSSASASAPAGTDEESRAGVRAAGRSEARNRAQERKQQAAARLEAVRRGWSLDTARAVTIGELYLMFGREGKVQLEYWWEEAPVAALPTPLTPPAPAPAPAAADSRPLTSPVAAALLKLVSITKLNYRKSKLMCPCGHVCGNPGKSGTRARPSRTQQVATDSTDTGSSSGSGSAGLVAGEAGGAGVAGGGGLAGGGGAATGGATGPERRPAPHRPIPSRLLLPTVQDGVFRRPLLAPSLHRSGPPQRTSAAEAFKAQLEKFRPRYCNRRGRSVRQKGVVVQRMLPLLPKVPNGHAMLALKVIPQTSSQVAGEFIPIGPQLGVGGFALPSPPHTPPPLVPQLQPPVRRLPTLAPAPAPFPSPEPVLPAGPCPSPPPLSSPPPSISNLLDLELGSAAGDDISLSGVSSGLLDAALEQETVRVPEAEPQAECKPHSPPEGGPEPVVTCTAVAPAGFGTQWGGLASNLPPPSPTPTLLLKEEGQWLDSEVGDYSLSSLLGHLESPVKQALGPGEESDVEAQLQCLMSENSVDYTAKFADLAAQIAASAEKK